MSRPAHATQPPPSRHANPFATCWTRPGALAFRFAADESAERLVAQLAVGDWRGEIVGPHGSGKSTLLETLKPHLVAAGRSVASVTLRDGQRRLPAGFLRKSLAASRPLVIVDGYEQLSWLSRRMLHVRSVRAAAGLVVASHTSTGLPLLYRTQPDRRLAEQLVSTLTANISSRITSADVAASHACHGSNLRELILALYDRHEALVSDVPAVPQTAACSHA